jgi:hypothetical protein
MNSTLTRDLLYRPITVNGLDLGVLLAVRLNETDAEIWYLANAGVCCEFIPPTALSSVEVSGKRFDADDLAGCLRALLGLVAEAAHCPERHQIERSFLKMVTEKLPQIMKVNEISKDDLESAISGLFR